MSPEDRYAMIAAHALQGLLANPNGSSRSEAMLAAQFADDLMTEITKRFGPDGSRAWEESSAPQPLAGFLGAHGKHADDARPPFVKPTDANVGRALERLQRRATSEAPPEAAAPAGPASLAPPSARPPQAK